MFLELGGKQIELKWTMSGVYRIEKHMKKEDPDFNLLQAFADPDFETMVLQLWAAMLKTNRSATIDQAGELADEIGFSRFAKDILPVLQNDFFPEPDEDEKDSAEAGNLNSPAP